MLNRYKKVLSVATLACLLTLLIPLGALAATPDLPGTGGPGGGHTGGGPITNPIDPINDIGTLINKILEIVVDIGVPIVALALIYVGFLFVEARGSEDKLKKAKEAFVYSIIGAAIVLGAFVISTAIEATVDDITGRDGGSTGLVPTYMIGTAWAAGPEDPAGGSGLPVPAGGSGLPTPDNTTVASIVDTIIIGNIINPMIILLFALSVLLFLIGVTKYIQKGSEDQEREKAKKLIIYGIIGLAIMLSVWGLVNVVVKTFFPDGAGSIPDPEIPTFEFGA